MKRYIHYREEDAVGIITIDNPPRNALTTRILEELVGLVHDLPWAGVKAIVLTGGDRCFCTGMDIDELRHIETKERAQDLLEKGRELLHHLEGFPLPVLAAINGVCLGGGLELALACHVRYVSETAVFGFPELSLGIVPAFGGMRLLLKSVRHGKAAELLLRGTMLNAREAKELGLVEGILPRKELLSEVIQIAKAIARKNPHAVQLVLELLRTGAPHLLTSNPDNDDVLGRLFASTTRPLVGLQ